MRSSGTSPAASRARSKRLSGRAGIVREEQVRPVRIEPEPRARLGARDRAEALERDADRQHRHAPRACPRRGRLRLNARETAAGSAVNGSAARVDEPSSGGRTGRCRAASRRPARGAPRAPGSAERPKWACTTSKRRAARCGGGSSRSRAAARAGRAGTRTPRPRRRRAAAAPRPGRARTSRAGARPADGHMFVTTSARTRPERTFVTRLVALSAPNARRAVRPPRPTIAAGSADVRRRDGRRREVTRCRGSTRCRDARTRRWRERGARRRAGRGRSSTSA